ncbi:metalloendopeptidase homolog PEX [Drosophila serrata]|uniref:metalloendopeptidase homolog PEX n=1 Tax=Drosophila serrata TaxID=7274 RepID=UPI000A1D04A7|nr:metalloendopeptidase homolog PEX [Drosophila serrata]
MLQGIFQTLKHRFGQKLRANRNAFGRKSLKFLLSKLEHMTLRLSILPRQKSDHSLERRIERHYHDLQLNASDYYGNLLATLKHSTEQQLHSLLRLLLPWLGKVQTKRGQPLPVEVHGFGSFGSPFYMLSTNTLVVPLSLLGPPLYSPGQSELLSYSSLGFILGHELSHGFTPDAVRIDSRGRAQIGIGLEVLRNRRFRDEATCLRFRFGAEQLEEKFADANGLDLAYSAYFDAAEGDRRWDENSIEPGQTSTLRQQHFFLNFAQFFCSDEDSSQDNDDHGTDRRRVNDAVANFEPFQQAFNCSKSWFEKRYRQRTQCRLY